MPRLTALAATLPDTVPFVGPETQERARGRAFRARVGANESGFGPSPRVVAAMAEAAAEAWRYCDPDNFELKASLARHLGVTAENVVVGEGIDGLLGLTVRLFAEPGAAVVTSLGAYPTFNFHVAGFGARLITVPYRGDGEDLDALLIAARREKAAIVYVSNPDNPMGSWHGAGEIERFADALPEDTLLVLDEAYGETAPDGTLPPMLPLRPNVLRYRTFSKAYGLAGLRCGYVVGEASLVRAFDKVRNHFGVNRMAQVAGLAALADHDYLDKVVAQVDAARRRIAVIAAANGLRPLPSATNFVTIDCGADGAFALKVLQQLVARDVFVRKPMAPGLDRCIRVSAAPEAELAIFAAELPAALAAARTA
ncbi:MAG: pyridoxal phosphate-dependent aminotransferase [Rhizobiaceae bacterium]|nr:pyridoxal phosphate-dependent aminotransferase [Rhizobiaceae bacterium]